MADTQSASHKIFGYSKKKLQYIKLNEQENKSPDNIKKKNKKENGYYQSIPKFILHPYKEEETSDQIIILQPSNIKNDNKQLHRENRTRSAGTQSKSKKTMKKPKNHRLYKNKNKPSLKPSDSDTTNKTTHYKKSHQANQRKKRLFGIDSHQRVISYKTNHISNNSSSISNSEEHHEIQRKTMSHSPQKRNSNQLNIKNETNINNESKTDNLIRKESASFTTDDLCITYKKGHKVSFRPSGRNNDEWKKGVIHDITHIDNIQYLSIMTEINAENNTFATFYIPLNDKQRVRPYNNGLRLRTTRSNTSYSNTQLMRIMRLGIGGVFTDYDINDVIINTKKQQIIYKDDIITIPNINTQSLDKWSSLEVCAWLICIQHAKYSHYITSIIENNVNGKALKELTFVTMMKLTKYQMNVTDCTNLLNHIKLLKPSPSPAVKSRKSKRELVAPAVHDNQFKPGVIETSDDMDIPLFTNDNDNSNQVVIEQGRFWRLFYFPKLKTVQYDVDKPVSKWTPYEVSLWMHDIFNNKFSIYSHYFIQHQIDGQSLLNMTRKSATNDLKMISPNIRRLFFDELRALSTLQPCGIRQYHDPIQLCPDPQQIKRLTHRFTQVQQSPPKMFSPKRSKSVDTGKNGKNHEGNNEVNDARDIMVAQKIIKGIHEQTASRNNIVIADMIKRGPHKHKKHTETLKCSNNSHNTEKIHNFVSGEEDDDEEVVTLPFQHLKKGDMDFYNDTNLHFVEYSDETTCNNNNDDVDIKSPTHKPVLCVAALFNATDANTLSDEPDIEQINKKFDKMDGIVHEEDTPNYKLTEQPLSIGTVASIETIEHIDHIDPNCTSLASNASLSNHSNAPSSMKFTKDSRQSSYTTDHTLSPRQVQDKERGSTLLINLTTHENKTSLLVEGSIDLSISNSHSNMKRVSDNKNIHSSFVEYSRVTDEHDELEIDVWDNLETQNNYNKQHCFLDSFMDHGFDDNDPLFTESLSPMVSKFHKKQTKNTISASASFPFDIEEKMNEVGGDILCHEPNVTLEIDQ